MAESIFNQPHFQDADKAREYLEALRWPNGPVCPHCGSINEKHLKLGEGSKHYRPGLYKCADCYQQFSVTVGTLFERSKIALNVWLQAVHLICASKKGMSAKQLERMLGVTYKTAWFMAHRIREAMTANPTDLLGATGGGNGQRTKGRCDCSTRPDSCACVEGSHGRRLAARADKPIPAGDSRTQ